MIALVLAMVLAMVPAVMPATPLAMPLVTSASSESAQVTSRTQMLIDAQTDFAASRCAPGHQPIRSHALRQQPAVLHAMAGRPMLLLLLVRLLGMLLLSHPGGSADSTFLSQVLVAAQALLSPLGLNFAPPDLLVCWLALYFGFQPWFPATLAPPSHQPSRGLSTRVRCLHESRRHR